MERLDERQKLIGIDLNLLWWHRSPKGALDVVHKELFDLIAVAAEDFTSDIYLCGEEVLNAVFRLLPAVVTDCVHVYVEDPDKFRQKLEAIYPQIVFLNGNAEFALVQFKLRYVRILDLKSKPKPRFHVDFKILGLANICVRVSLQSICCYTTAYFKQLITPSFYEFSLMVGLWRLKRKARYLAFRMCEKLNLVVASQRLQFKYLSEDEFLKLSLHSCNPLHEKIRKSSIDLVTDNQKNWQFGEIRDYFSVPKNLSCKLELVYFTRRMSSSPYPKHFDFEFWDGTNIHYLMPLLLGFRRGIAPYEEVQLGDEVKYFDLENMKALPFMDDEEVSALFEESPIEVLGPHVISGRHRCFAMIGRLVQKKGYIHVKVRFF